MQRNKTTFIVYSSRFFSKSTKDPPFENYRLFSNRRKKRWPFAMLESNVIFSRFFSKSGDSNEGRCQGYFGLLATAVPSQTGFALKS